MDAKPQKPVRGFRVHGDENALPVLPANKTLHSRNKSSPALSTMATAGINRMPLKRAAFGDVSNTAQANRPAKDDSTISAKPSIYESKEYGNFQPKAEVKASAALLRPAQRPLPSTNSLKSLNNIVSTTATAIGTSSLQDSKNAPASTANIRKTLTKKSTTVFKDTTYQEDEAEEVKSIVPLKREVPQQRQPSLSISHGDAKPMQHQVRKVQSSYSFLPNSQATKLDAIQPSPYHPVPALPVQEELPQTYAQLLPLPQPDEQDYRYESDAQLASLIAKVETSVSTSDGTYAPKEENTKPSETMPKPQATEFESKIPLATVGEADEYWDDEEEEENYEEEGYVTARSFKSRGENVTGNATQTLVPRTNHKARHEIEAAKLLVESTKTQEELEDEAWDTTMVAEYGDEIFEYMHGLENKLQPNPHYMDVQTEIQWSMRSVLMDWLVQVHHRFQLLPETLFLCVNYIDRFLSYKVVSLGKLQLVGATAIFVAAKYEEINCPSVNEIVYMVDNGYTVDEILKAERFMLSMLQYELGWPGPMSFLRRISKADDYDLETRTLAKYFLEITIMDERFLGCPPSFTAAGAHCLARMMLQKGNWTPHHVYYSNYTYAQLLPLLQLLVECCEDPTKHHAAIYDKYQDKKFKCASRFVHNEMRKGFQIPDVSTNNVQTFMNFYETSPWNDNKPMY